MSRFLIIAALLSILLFAMPFSFNRINATHMNCTNWANLFDKDCDGLADTWEINKFYEKSVGSNTIRVDLPSSVNKDHRDSLVEIDYMSHHIPPGAAIDAVVSRFSPMELLNPDGTYGVNLHYIIDDNVAHKTCINIWTDTDSDPTNDYANIKKNFMGTESERNTSVEFYQAKRDVYHYALFIHTRCGTISEQQSAGGAETPGNDAFVSLGYPGWGNVIDGHDTGSTDYKTRSFMHEYGHNFNLKHGGSADTPHCKPNYISVMNYLFEFPTYVNLNLPDYSHNVIPSLNENSLVEANGIGPSSPIGLPTSIGHSTFTHLVPPYHDLDTTGNNVPVNYNWYKGDTDTSDTVSSSITNLHFNPCNDATKQSLYGFDDVHYNSLTFWSTSGTFQNSTGVFMTSDVGSAKVSDDLAPKLKKDILKNSTLPPCDISVRGCVDLPCDPKDPYCKTEFLVVGHNFSDPSLQTMHLENETMHQELTVSDVLHAINSKVLDIDQYIQSLNSSKFSQGTNVSKLKTDLQYSLVNATESVYSLINSSKSDEALVKLSNLRSLVDGTHSSIQILQPPNNLQLLKLIDELSIALEKKQ